MAHTKRIGHEPIEMRRMLDIDDFEEAGDFCWVTALHGISLWLAIPVPQSHNPDKCRNWCLSEWKVTEDCKAPGRWAWNGDLLKPTLTPSLHAINIWHGWVRDGMLVEA